MKDDTRKTSTAPESESGFPIQLILLALGIAVGLAILIMEFAGTFSGAQ